MKTETATQTVTPVFVPKQEGVVALTLDESIEHVKALQAEKAKLEKTIDNLKEVAKSHMKAKGVESYITPSGIRANWSESQRSDIDKELAKELLGPDWARVHSFKTVKSFTVK